MMLRPNNSLDRSGDSLFLNMNGAAKVASIRAARSTLTFGVLFNSFGCNP